MIVAQYSRDSARQLAASLVATAAGPSHSTGTPSDVRVVEMGGGWQSNTWRHELRQLAQRGTATALTLRTGPNERELPDELWARISQRLARRLGLAKQPWVAIRTGATTVALFTEAPNRPLPREAAVDFAREATTRYRLWRRDGLDRVDAQRHGANQTTAATPSPRGIAGLSFNAPPDAAPEPARPALPQPTLRSMRPPTNPPRAL